MPTEAKKPTGTGLIGQVGAKPCQTILVGTGPHPLAYVAIAIMVWFLIDAFLGR